MYNLLVSGGVWDPSRDTMMIDRIFEYTDVELAARFKFGTSGFKQLLQLPALFVEETRRGTVQFARIGTIHQTYIEGKNLALSYILDPQMPAFTNEKLEQIMGHLGITSDWEFSRTHWAVKDVDLFRTLLPHVQPQRSLPNVFSLNMPEVIDRRFISAMMPFAPAFSRVYETIEAAEANLGLRCARADNVWEHHAIIQDIVSLIDRSKVVICDCTGRNPNVFYEAGIAHALGREVILITQSGDDIPFDLKHLRYLPYLNNGEGLAQLLPQLQARVSSLI